MPTMRVTNAEGASESSEVRTRDLLECARSLQYLQSQQLAVKVEHQQSHRCKNERLQASKRPRLSRQSTHRPIFVLYPCAAPLLG